LDKLRLKHQRPEAIIQRRIESMLRQKGWYVLRTHGGMYQAGFPDDFACHKLYGQRWVEVKLPDMKGSKFTKAQIEVFPELCKNGSGVWILMGDSLEEYNKLFEPANYWKCCNIWR